MPSPEPAVDRFGRAARDLRISITDRCNFRCTYCMPEEGMQWLPRGDVLTFEEIELVARVAVERLGVRSIRLTGGEPTLRSHLPVLVGRLGALAASGLEDLAMTTNGATLGLLAQDLAAAGLRRVNISLDTLRRDRFLELTRRDRLDQVLEGIDAAVAAGLTPVKLNAVVVRGVNDDELVDLAAYARDHGVELRCIEVMPLDAQQGWDERHVVPTREIVERIGAAFPLEPEARGHAPAATWRYLDGKGRVGVVGSVTEPFCGDCDRVRLTAEGQLRTCLFGHDETDLRAILRDPDLDETARGDALEAAIRTAVGNKWAGHAIGNVQFLQPRRAMSQIGG